jgi:hypothetical protein
MPNHPRLSLLSDKRTGVNTDSLLKDWIDVFFALPSSGQTAASEVLRKLTLSLPHHWQSERIPEGIQQDSVHTLAPELHKYPSASKRYS